jgi:hypothetical protein
MHKPELAAQKPLLFSVSHKRHRVSNVDLSGQLPVQLQHGKDVSLSIHIPKVALPAQRAVILVHSGGDIALEINGNATDEFPSSRRRSEIFVEYIDHNCEHRPAKEDCRIFRLNTDLLKTGENTIGIVNKAGIDLEIGRVNLGIW